MTRENEPRALESCDTGQATDTREFADGVMNEANPKRQSSPHVGPDSITAGLDVRFEAQIRGLMRSNLADNHKLDRVADRLSLTPRALQRLLADEGTSFSEILDDERETLAKQHLAQKTRLRDIAALLGFAGASSFSRAFQRWTGTPPAAYRRECRRGRRERTPDVA